ncbi:13489_t:CDS:2, partial [Dentiscutata erythropus]
MYRRKYCNLCKRKLFSEKDFNNDDDISLNTELTISDKLSYISDEGFVVLDKKTYFCSKCNQYRYSEFHTCVNLKKYQLTDSIKINLDKIIEMISKKYTSIKHSSKKRKAETDFIEDEIQFSVSSPSV